MAVVQTQIASSGASTVASLGATMASNLTAGNLVVVAADIEWGGSVPAMSISDTLGNAWTQPAGFETNPDVSDTGIWYCWNCKGGADTVTITVNTGVTGGNVNVAMIVREYSGVQNTSDPLDKAVIASGSSTALSSGATAATTNANDLVVGIGTSEHPGATFTLGSGYGNLSTEIDSNLPHEALAIEDKTVSATGAQTATFTQGTASFWICAVMAFKLAAATAGATYIPARIPNRRVGPVAMRRNFRQPYVQPSGISSFAGTKTQPAIARIAQNLTKTQPAIARIAVNLTKTQPATARIANNQTKTQTATARIAVIASRTQSATARIQRNLTKTQSATANIYQAFSWKGYTWIPRFASGAPSYNGQWSQANVIGPDGSDYVTLRVTNPGSSPVSAEFDSQQQGWGYGTYTTVVGSRIDNMYGAIVFGGMFTYDGVTNTGDTAISHNEIDLMESSGGTTSPGYWYNNAGVDTDHVTVFPATTDAVTTHQLVWAPGKIVMRAFAGTGTTGILLHAATYTTNIPVPASESIGFNLWVQSANTPASTPQTDVVLRDFTFSSTPATVITQAATARISNGFSQFTENFAAASIDSTKWSSFNGGSNTISQATGQLVISTTTTAAYSGYDSQKRYDLTSSFASIQLVNAGNQSLSSLEVTPLTMILDGNNTLFWYVNGGSLAAYKKVGGTNTSLASTTYNSSVHKYLRIREASGTTYFDYSTDGMSWTNFASLANPFAVTNLQLEIATGTYSNEASGTSATFDNLTILPSIVTKTQTAVARVATNITKTQSATARIGQTGTKTQSAVARVANIVTKTQSAIARIQRLLTKTQSAVARVANNLTKTQTAVARIANNPTKTQTAIARIQKVVTKTQPAVARIASNLTKTQSAVARVAVNPTKTQTAVSRIAVIITKTQSATARIQRNLTKTQSAIAKIVQSGGGSGTSDSYPESNQDNSDALYSGYRSYRAQSFTAANSANLTASKFYLSRSGSPTGNVISYLYAHSGTYGSSSLPTGSPLATSDPVDITTVGGASLALVQFNFSTPYAMTAGTHYEIVVSYTGGDSSNHLTYGYDTSSPSHSGNPAYSTDGSTWTQQFSTDDVFYVLDDSGGGALTKTQSAVARIATNLAKTQSAVSRIANIVTKTQPATARIQRLLAKTQSAVARIAQPGTKTQTATARIANSPTRTQSAIARVAVNRSLTQPAVSRIAVTLTKTQSATARIGSIATIRTFTQTATARIVTSGLSGITITAEFSNPILNLAFSVPAIAAAFSSPSVAVALSSPSLTAEFTSPTISAEYSNPTVQANFL